MTFFFKIGILIIIAFITVPSSAFAALTSESYEVDSEMVAVDAVTALGNSSSYSVGGGDSKSYIYDPTSDPDVPVSLSGRTYGTLEGNRLKDTSSQTMTENDLLVICHDHDGERYVIYTTTKVFLALVEAYKDVPYGGHDTHPYDIIPSFQYRLNGESGYYPGYNWTPQNEELHDNGCEKYLSFSVQSEKPEALKSAPKNSIIVDYAPVPPVEEIIAVCEDKNSSKRITTAINDQTILTIDIPSDAFRISSSEEEKYIFRAQPVNESLYETRYARFQQKLSVYDETVSLFENVPYIAPNLEFSAGSPTSIPYEPKCENDDEGIEVSQLEPETNRALFSTLPTYWRQFLTGEHSGRLGLITTPFKISVDDEKGNQLESFTNPIQLRISNAAVAESARKIYVTKPSADAENWFEVPFSVVGDEVVIQLSSPAELYIWYVVESKDTEPESLTDEVVAVKTYPYEEFFPALIVLFILLLLIIILIMSLRRKKEREEE